jgi:hypothetical protein
MLHNKGLRGGFNNAEVVGYLCGGINKMPGLAMAFAASTR